MTSTNDEDQHEAMRIGVDAIRGEAELCIFAIGLGQLVGRCVGREQRTGRFTSLTRRRLVVGTYTTFEPVEIERRANPRQAPSFAARLVVGLTLWVVATAPKVAIGAAVAALLLPNARRLARAVAGYLDRELAQQRDLALVLAPFAGLLVWLAVR